MPWGVSYSEEAWRQLNGCPDPDALMREISDWARPGPPCENQRTLTHPETGQLFVVYDQRLRSGYLLNYTLGVQPNAIVFVVNLRRPPGHPPA
jgi:hypothetical protein